MPENLRLKHQVRTRLNQIQMARLEGLCEQTGESKSEVMRACLMERHLAPRRDDLETRIMLQVGLLLKRGRPTSKSKTLDHATSLLRTLIKRRLA